MSPWAAELYKENLRGEALAAGMELEPFRELAAAVSKHMDELDHARLRVTQ
jgi:hypothetical protein